MDVLTQEQRKKCMGNIKGRNTKPELAVRSLCHRLGYRFRIHNTKLPGTPDLVFARLKLCVFVHGCFWHRHSNCKYAYHPKTRVTFWSKKFSENCERDSRNLEELKSLGWAVAIVWECELRNVEKLTERMTCILSECDRRLS